MELPPPTTAAAAATTTSPNPPQSHASDLVFSTPELLETILTHLPPLDLLLAQRVSTTFNDLISTSPPLQRALFMRADWTLEAAPYTAYRAPNRPGERPRNNRMLRRVLDGMYPTVTLKVTNADSDDDGYSNSTTEILPLATSPATSFDLGAKDRPLGPSAAAQGHWSWDVNITFPADRPHSADPAVLYEGASWRRMFLCQPPCTTLHLVRRWQRAREAAVQCETGIRMGLFVEAGAEGGVAGKRWDRGFVASDRDWHFEGGIKCSRVGGSERQEITRVNREVVYDQVVLERLYGTGYLGNHH